MSFELELELETCSIALCGVGAAEFSNKLETKRDKVSLKLEINLKLGRGRTGRATN